MEEQDPLRPDLNWGGWLFGGATREEEDMIDRYILGDPYGVIAKRREDRRTDELESSLNWIKSL